MRKNTFPPPFTFGQRTSTISFYVSTVASGGNDNAGGTVGAPVATAVRAFNLAKATAILRPGPIEIVFNADYVAGSPVATAHTVTSQLSYTSSLMTTSPVTFRGPNDIFGAPILLAGRPIITVQGSTNGSRRSGSFISATQGCSVTVQNLKFQSFSTAFQCSQGGRLQGSGVVDIRNCTVGFSGANKSWMNFAPIKGDWDGRDLAGNAIANSICFRSIINGTHNLQQTALGDVDAHDWDRIILVGDGGGSGHTDNMLVRKCRIGFEFTRGAGAANLTGMQFEDCSVCGILSRGTRGMIISENAVFINCADNIICTDHPSSNTVESTTYDVRPGWLRSAGVTTQSTGNGTEASLWAPIYITKGRMRARDTVGKFDIHLSFASLSSDATIKLRMGATTAGPTGTVLTTFTIPSGSDHAKIFGTLKAIDKNTVAGLIEYKYGSGGTISGEKYAKFGQSATVMNASDYTGVTFTITLANGNKVTLDPTTDIFTTVAFFDGYISPPDDGDPGV